MNSANEPILVLSARSLMKHSICPFYPGLGDEVEPGWKELDPDRPESRDWTMRCLAEFCAFSHWEYFLIGGDEWQPPLHLLESPGFDAGLAWIDHINRAVEFLSEKGLRPPSASPRNGAVLCL